MTAAILVCAPRLSYRFLLIVLFAAAYPLWHADLPVPANENAEMVAVPVQTAIPPMSAPSVNVERAPAASSVSTRLGACRGSVSSEL